jgi:hypothetical protein
MGRRRSGFPPVLVEQTRNQIGTESFVRASTVEAKMSKETSPKAAKAASKTLRDGRTAKDSKTAAGSALSQKE